MNKRKLRRFIIWLAASVLVFIVMVTAVIIIFNFYAGIISKGSPITPGKEPKSALLVLDIQEATTGEVSTDDYYMVKSDSLIRTLNRLSGKFRDYRLPVIFVRTEITNPVINLINSSFSRGGPGAKYDRRLKNNADYEVIKSVSDAFRKTDLDSILVKSQVNNLFIAGLDAAGCIKATAEAAKNRNYRVSIVEDAVISTSDALKDSMMIYFRNRHIDIINSDSIRPSD